jgi:hypothetical protein
VQGSLDLFVSLPNADPRIRFRRPSTVRAALLLLALLSGRDDRPRVRAVRLPQSPLWRENPNFEYCNFLRTKESPNDALGGVTANIFGVRQ